MAFSMLSICAVLQYGLLLYRVESFTPVGLRGPFLACSSTAPASLRRCSSAFPPAPFFTLPRSSYMAEASDAEDVDEKSPDDVVACRIVVSGDVQGGYYRSCVLNEAGRFRKLVGTMTPPDDTDTAEIYVEGKRKLVEGFVRWCKKSDKKVALNQKITVQEVFMDDVPTGLYDDFDLKTK